MWTKIRAPIDLERSVPRSRTKSPPVPPRRAAAFAEFAAFAFAAIAAVAALAGGAPIAEAAPAPSDSSPRADSSDPVSSDFVALSALDARDLPAKGRLFDRGIPIGRDAISPEGFHLAYLHQVPGKFPRRRPERCAFLLDLGTLENRAVPTPKGRANRIAGWDPTGRYVLIESSSPHLLSPFTGSWTSFHWVFDVVTSQFPQRKPFTGMRGGERFRWKRDGTYHGVWDDAEGTTVVPLVGGELAEIYAKIESALDGETKRRTEKAGSLAVGANPGELRTLEKDLIRLDEHWTRRGQKDPVVSDLFGERPNLYARRAGQWIRIAEEIEYLAVLDHGIALVTLEGGRQILAHLGRAEIVPIPAVPEEFALQLATRWDRAGGAYDEADPLPRDLQYRRAADPTTGITSYFNYVTPDVRRALLLYSIDAENRVLRVVDLPPSWGAPVSALSALPSSGP